MADIEKLAAQVAELSKAVTTLVQARGSPAAAQPTKATHKKLDRPPIVMTYGPKPPGQPGRSEHSKRTNGKPKGYSLQDKLGLNDASYQYIRDVVKLASGRHLNVRESWKKQKASKINLVVEYVCSEIPEFTQFDDPHWPIHGFIQMGLKTSSAGHRNTISALKGNNNRGGLLRSGSTKPSRQDLGTKDRTANNGKNDDDNSKDVEDDTESVVGWPETPEQARHSSTPSVSSHTSTPNPTPSPPPEPAPKQVKNKTRGKPKQSMATQTPPLASSNSAQEHPKSSKKRKAGDEEVQRTPLTMPTSALPASASGIPEKRRKNQHARSEPEHEGNADELSPQTQDMASEPTKKRKGKEKAEFVQLTKGPPPIPKPVRASRSTKSGVAGPSTSKRVSTRNK